MIENLLKVRKPKKTGVMAGQWPSGAEGLAGGNRTVTWLQP